MRGKIVTDKQTPMNVQSGWVCWNLLKGRSLLHYIINKKILVNSWDEGGKYGFSEEKVFTPVFY